VNEGRALGTIALFALGLVAGVVLHQVVEPAAAHDVAQAIQNDDARSLGKLLSSQMLTDLDAALQPIVDVRTAKFVGAVESEGRLLSAYVATGKTTEGTDFVVGFVLRVSNDQVVGVN